MNLKDNEKQALVRCLSDLMKADNIIASDEINFLESRCKEYSISFYDIEKSLGISLQEATEILKSSKTSVRQRILKQLMELSLSDGFCAVEEALLIWALSLSLSNKTKELSRIISVPSPRIDFGDSQVLFLESYEEPRINSIITGSIHHIVNNFKIAGFDFIYIPQVSQHFKMTDPTLFTKIIKYLAPTLSEEETRKVMKELKTMTTHSFYNIILKEKLGLDFTIQKPSLLIKIATSYVNGEKMSDFLLINVDENFVSFTQDIIDKYLSYQWSTPITIRNYSDSGGNFIYMGLYKTIFDLVTYRKGVRSKLIINHSDNKNRIIIEGTERINLDLGLAETALYEFIIRESISKYRGISFYGKGEKAKEEIRKRFEKIYVKFLGYHSKVPDIMNPSTRNPLLAKIRKSINGCAGLTERGSFLPETKSHITFVPLDAHLVFVDEGHGEKNILESS